jgi:hypothetical protein
MRIGPKIEPREPTKQGEKELLHHPSLIQSLVEVLLGPFFRQFLIGSSGLLGVTSVSQRKPEAPAVTEKAVDENARWYGTSAIEEA